MRVEGLRRSYALPNLNEEKQSYSLFQKNPKSSSSFLSSSLTSSCVTSIMHITSCWQSVGHFTFLYFKNICNALYKKYDIIGLSSSISKNSNFEIRKFDLVEDNGIDIGKIDCCLHLAALTDNKLCNENKEFAHKVNVLGTYKILELCKKANCKKFIYISTGSVYGFTESWDNKQLSEKDKPRPLDVYTSTKYLGELATKKYEEFFSVIVLRYFWPYGMGKNSFINRLIYNIINSKTIHLNNGNKPFINPIFITDLVEATKKVLEQPNVKGIYNIAGCETKNIKQLSEIISEILNIEPIFCKTGKDVGNIAGNTDKIKNELGFIPKITLKEGLELSIKNS